MTNNIELVDYSYKIIIIGDSNVGKTTLLNSLITGKYIHQTTTIGVDFKTKNVTVGDTDIKLKIWDTAGQERFRTIVNTFYRHAQAIIIVYDITNLESFESIHRWLNDCIDILGIDTLKNIPIILVGNKSDLIVERKVSIDYAQEVANNLGFLLVETNAKNIELVNNIFIHVANIIKQKYYDNDQFENINSIPTIKLNELKNESTNNCIGYHCYKS